MQLIVLGLNHKTAPVEIRERFNFSQDRTVRVLRRLRNNDNLNEAVLLSTCNRTELYMVLEDPAAGLHFIRTLLRHLAGEQYKPDYFYNLTGINCVRHLFKVASSLDSLINLELCEWVCRQIDMEPRLIPTEEYMPEVECAE